MEELEKLEEERGTAGIAVNGGVETAGGKKGKRERIASNEMCTFLILNISSLQLIPVNMIAYRSQYGSVNPAGIIARRLWRRLSVRRQRWFIVRGRTGGGEFENNSPPFVQYEKLY